MIPAGKKKEDAQLTVMMSLLILILLTFTAGILESASIQTSKNIRRADTERAVESLFAEYQKELLEEYEANVRSHALRHIGASLLLTNGESMEQIQQTLIDIDHVFHVHK